MTSLDQGFRDIDFVLGRLFQIEWHRSTSEFDTGVNIVDAVTQQVIYLRWRGIQIAHPIPLVDEVTHSEVIWWLRGEWQ